MAHQGSHLYDLQVSQITKTKKVGPWIFVYKFPEKIFSYEWNKRTVATRTFSRN